MQRVYRLRYDRAVGTDAKKLAFAGVVVVAVLALAALGFKASRGPGRPRMVLGDCTGKGCDLVVLTGRKPKPLCDAPLNRADPVVSPVAGRIAYMERTPPKYSLHSVNADCSEDRVLATYDDANPEHISWSPDGESLLYVVFVHGKGWDVFVVPRDGSSAPAAVAANEGDDFGATWSPDGSAIAFVSKHGKSADVYTVARDGTGAIPVTQGQQVSGWVAWSRDGTNTLAFGTGGDIATVHVGDAEPRVVVTSKSAGDLHLESPIFSPDGAWIAFSGSHVGSNASSTIYKNRVFVAKTDGSSAHVVIDGQASCYAFFPDGRIVLSVAKFGGDGIYAFPVAGGNGDLVERVDGCPSWAPVVRAD